MSNVFSLVQHNNLPSTFLGAAKSRSCVVVHDVCRRAKVFPVFGAVNADVFVSHVLLPRLRGEVGNAMMSRVAIVRTNGTLTDCCTAGVQTLHVSPESSSADSGSIECNPVMLQATTSELSKYTKYGPILSPTPSAILSIPAPPAANHPTSTHPRGEVLRPALLVPLLLLLHLCRQARWRAYQPSSNA